jgi:hypothetical protein
MSTPEGPPGGPPPTPGAPATGAYAAGQDYPPPGYQQAPPAPYPPQGPPPQYGGQGHGGGGPGFGERASHAVDAIGRHVKTPETKEFFKTSEFLVWVLTVVALLIAGAVIGGGADDDTLRADLVRDLGGVHRQPRALQGGHAPGLRRRPDGPRRRLRVGDVVTTMRAEGLEPPRPRATRT